MKYIFFTFIILLLSCSDYPTPFSYELSNQFKVGFYARSLEIDREQGLLYVLSSRENQIEQYDLQGNLLLTFADSTMQNSGKYDLYLLFDLVVDEYSKVFFIAVPYKIGADGYNIYDNGFCIIKLNSNSEYLQEFDYTNTDESWHPSKLTYSNNSLFVTNGSRLTKINTENGISKDFVFNIQNPISFDPNYIHTSDIAIDFDDNIWLVGQADWDADTPDNWKVGVHMTRFDSNCDNQKTFYAKSKVTTLASAMNRPGITFDNDNNMYLVTCYGQSIEFYGFDQEFQYEIPINDKRSYPTDIAIDYNNTLYVLDGYNERVLIYELKN